MDVKIEKRVWAIMNYQCHEMFQMTTERMDALLNTPITHNIVGIPRYYEYTEGMPVRFWPAPCEGCTVAKDL